MSVAIFRFCASEHDCAVCLSEYGLPRTRKYDGLRELITAEWQSLSPFRANITGEPFKLGDRERDEIRLELWRGPRTLTRYAPK